jgi:Xaa-Pro aminopeptidase
MFPVNGRYTELQCKLYGFMVAYHKVLLKLIRPGALPKDILAAAAEQMEPVIAGTHFPKGIYEEAARRTLSFRGHLSHPVGMAVHDVGRYFERPMPVGLVITIDPQMWVPEERLYIRVEDTITVTEGGIEVFTKRAPLELDDVEAAMREEGILDKVSLKLQS